MDSGWSQKLSNSLATTREWMARVNRAFYMGPAGYIWMGIVCLALIIAAIAVILRLRRTNRLRVNRKSVEKDPKPDSELFVEAMETLSFKAKLRKESSR